MHSTNELSTKLGKAFAALYEQKILKIEEHINKEKGYLYMPNNPCRGLQGY